MTTWIYAGAASLLIVASGLVHGVWTDRWYSSIDITEAADRLATLPMNVGEWEGKNIESRASQHAPGVTGSVQRLYTNRRLGASVVVALVNGRPGPVATHTPEACYGASGYKVGKKKSIAMDFGGVPAQFWTADAVRRKVAEQEKIRIYWAWNAGTGWTASQDARNEFPRLRHAILHKLYVLRDLNQPGASAPGHEPCEVFLKAFLPAMQSSLFATSAAS